MKIQQAVNKSGYLKGQALLELTVFGAIIIMLLGVLINYGMRYNFQVQAMQEAFRKALGYASKSNDNGNPTSVSYIMIKDKHIPQPANPFGIGSVIPISASANVTRNYRSQDSADSEAELPRVAIDIEGAICPKSHDCPSGGCPSPCTYLVAGFRYERNVDKDYMAKYQEIWGTNAYDNGEEGECLEGGPSDPESGLCACMRPSWDTVTVLDSCEGEILDYNTAIRQCRQITDVEYCKSECEKGKAPGSDTDCNQVCGYNINVPWYCSYVKKNAGGKYVFEVSGAGKKSMGLQSGYEKTTNINNTGLTKKETASGITTIENIDWEDETNRKIVLKPLGKTDAASFEEEIINSVYQQKKDKTLQTGW